MGGSESKGNSLSPLALLNLALSALVRAWVPFFFLFLDVIFNNRHAWNPLRDELDTIDAHLFKVLGPPVPRSHRRRHCIQNYTSNVKTGQDRRIGFCSLSWEKGSTVLRRWTGQPNVLTTSAVARPLDTSNKHSKWMNPLLLSPHKPHCTFSTLEVRRTCLQKAIPVRYPWDWRSLFPHEHKNHHLK